MRQLKPWHWGLIALLIAGGLIAGIGFIPIPHTVLYACTESEEYPCITNETYTCTKVRNVACTRSETYTYTVQVPYTAVEDQPLTYTTWGASASESSWDCDVWILINVRNTDTEGGYFTVQFSCVHGGILHTQTLTQYIDPSTSKEFKVEFLKNCGVEWSWTYPTVTPDTKQVVVQRYRQETRTGVREVPDLCPEPYQTICTREVENTCTREYQGTCFRHETKRLFWR